MQKYYFEMRFYLRCKICTEINIDFTIFQQKHIVETHPQCVYAKSIPNTLDALRCISTEKNLRTLESQNLRTFKKDFVPLRL